MTGGESNLQNQLGVPPLGGTHSQNFSAAGEIRPEVVFSLKMELQMDEPEIAAARETAREFLEHLAVEKWALTGLDPLFLAEGMIACGGGMLAAMGRGPEAAEGLRDLADELEQHGPKGHA